MRTVILLLSSAFSLPAVHATGTPAIPVQFHGTWDGSGELCTIVPTTDSRIAVSSGQVEYYETVCDLKRTVASHKASFTGIFTCTGEGRQSDQKISLKLDRHMMIHQYWGGSTRETRCSSPKASVPAPASDR